MLVYADGIVVMYETEKEVINKHQNARKKMRLHINKEKSKYLAVSKSLPKIHFIGVFT